HTPSPPLPAWWRGSFHIRHRNRPWNSPFNPFKPFNLFNLPGLCPTVRAVLAAFLTTILFSISVVCGHRSAKMIGGTEANFWRLTLATLMLGLWSYFFGIGLSGNAFPVFLLSGIMGIGIGDVALFQALPRLGRPRWLLS